MNYIENQIDIIKQIQQQIQFLELKSQGEISQKSQQAKSQKSEEAKSQA